MANKDLETFGNTLISSIEKLISEKTQFELSDESKAFERDIIEDEGKLNISGLEKFNSPCNVGAINFYLNEADKEAGKTVGALMVYIDEEYAPKLYKGFSFKGFQSDDEEVVMENTKAFVKLIAERLVSELRSKGYASLILGEPVAGRNSIQGGVSFHYETVAGIVVSSEYKYIETSYYLWKNRPLVADITLTKI